MDSQTPEFIELKDIVIKKKDQIYVLEKELIYSFRFKKSNK